MTRILCTGDRQIGVGGRLVDHEHIGRRIVEVAAERGCDLILDGGDVFEGPTITPAHYEAFLNPLAPWLANNPYVVISGNGRHDLATQDIGALEPLRHLSSNLSVVTRPDIIELAGVGIICLPWVSVSHLAARYGTGDRELLNTDAAELLVTIAHDQLRKFRAGSDAPAVLLAHWSISGAAFPSGLAVDQAREPIIPLSELEELGFDAIVASHIHKPQMLESRIGAAPGPIFYTGAPQQHDHGDGGQERGVWILDVGDEVSAEFVALGGRRFVTVSLFPEDATDAHAIPENLRDAIVRIRYTATAEQARRIDQGVLRQACLDAGAHTVTVEATTIRESRARAEHATETLTPQQALNLWVETQRIDPDAAERMHARFAGYLAEVAA